MANKTVYDSLGSKIVLSDSDHVATGGEGAIYIKNAKAYKLYLDSALQKSSEILKAISFFKQINHPSIACPQDVLRTKDGDFAGVVMPVAKGDPLCKLFTTTWQKANQFESSDKLKLVNNMREIVKYVHAHNAVIVDGNELNWMANRAEACLIDTDSWQFPGHKATAIMPSIRDPLFTDFSSKTDWFSWAVVTFQLWTGIHPFKGSHPNFKPGQFLDRMKKGISVFNADVSLPAAARPLSDIPIDLKNWYQNVFENNLRIEPPLVLNATATGSFAHKVTYAANAKVSLTKWFFGFGDILLEQNGFVILKSTKGLSLYELSTKSEQTWAADTLLKKVLNSTAVLTRANGKTMIVEIDNGVARCHSKQGVSADLLKTAATSLWTASNRVFMVNPAEPVLAEIIISELATKLFISVSNTWAVSPKASKFGKNSIVQDVLGTPFIGVFSREGFVHYKAKGLKGFAVVDVAAADPFKVVVKALKKQDGNYYNLTFSFDNKDSFELSSEVQSDEQLNFAVLPSQASVLSTNKSLILAKGASSKIVDYDTQDLQLCAGPDGLYAYQGDTVYKLAML